MSERTEYAKKHGVTLGIVISVVGLAALALGQLRLLESFGVVYDDTIEELVDDQGHRDGNQDRTIHSVREGLDFHKDLPGHGIADEKVRAIRERIDRIEDNQTRITTALSDLAIATEGLKAEVRSLRRERRDR